MSVSVITDTYAPIDRPVFSETPTGANVTERERDALLAVAEVVVLAVILVMALLGNGLVLVVLLRRRRHHNPLHQFMLNLCVADLVVALFQVTHTHSRCGLYVGYMCVIRHYRCLIVVLFENMCRINLENNLEM